MKLTIDIDENTIIKSFEHNYQATFDKDTKQLFLKLFKQSIQIQLEQFLTNRLSGKQELADFLQHCNLPKYDDLFYYSDINKKINVYSSSFLYKDNPASIKKIQAGILEETRRFIRETEQEITNAISEEW